MKPVYLLLLAFFASLGASAQVAGKVYEPVEKRYRYRVSLTDKKNNDFSLKHPERFLSAKSLERRNRFGLRLDERDLPLTQKYVARLAADARRVHCMSKWNNTVVLETADTLAPERWRKLPFVAAVERVWIGPDSVLKSSLVEDLYRQLASAYKTKTDSSFASPYGYAQRQVEMIGVDKLHAKGFTGRGVTVAVLDGGFLNADLIESLSRVSVLGTRNFVRPQRSVYREGDHGMMVLSCIAAQHPGVLGGTAPDADFYLFVTEDGDSEQPVEEDNWAAAMEHADSLGCDIVTSSLSYYKFDEPHAAHTYAEQNGRTALISKTASLAASRGILLLNSAGNEGDGYWKKIGFPADATDMLTVGAVNANGINTRFSSLGNTADGRVKPDVMAMGGLVSVTDGAGTVIKVNGTSFSCPLMCGAVACLLQASPKSDPKDIIEAVQKSGSMADAPNNVFGYGIPDMEKALERLTKNGRK